MSLVLCDNFQNIAAPVAWVKASTHSKTNLRFLPMMSKGYVMVVTKKTKPMCKKQGKNEGRKKKKSVAFLRSPKWTVTKTVQTPQ